MGNCLCPTNFDEKGPLLNSPSIQSNVNRPINNNNNNNNNNNSAPFIFTEKGVYRGGFGVISHQVQGIQPEDLTLEKYPEQEVHQVSSSVDPCQSHHCVPPPIIPIFLPIPIFYRPPIIVGVSPLHIPPPIRTPPHGIPPFRAPPPGYPKPPIRGAGGSGGGIYRAQGGGVGVQRGGHSNIHFGGGRHSGAGG